MALSIEEAEGKLRADDERKPSGRDSLLASRANMTADGDVVVSGTSS